MKKAKNLLVYVLFGLLSVGTYIVLDHYGAIDIAHRLIDRVEYGVEKTMEGK